MDVYQRLNKPVDACIGILGVPARNEHQRRGCLERRRGGPTRGSQIGEKPRCGKKPTEAERSKWENEQHT